MPRWPNIPPEQRFTKYIFAADNGCLEWTGCKWEGYGQFQYATKGKMRAHKWAYEFFFGRVPKGLELDHLCRNKSCVNVLHLEAVTHHENTLRGDVGKNNSSKTHCRNGHEFTTNNTRYTKLGRACKACGNAAQRRYQNKVKEKSICQ